MPTVQAIDLEPGDVFIHNMGVWIVKDTSYLADNVTVRITDTSGARCTLGQFEKVVVVSSVPEEAK